MPLGTNLSLSHYVLDWESKEMTKVAGLEIVTTEEGVPNPFRILKSTKREMQTINIEQPEGDTSPAESEGALR